MTTDDRDTVSEDEGNLDDSGRVSRSSGSGQTSGEASGSVSAKGSEPGSRKKHLPVWQESILLLGIALVLAIVIKAFFVQAFYIPSESMEPGLVKDDRILVEKWSYWGGADPERGDVVVFEDLVVGVDPTRSAAALEEIRTGGGHVDRSDMDEGLANPGGAQL